MYGSPVFSVIATIMKSDWTRSACGRLGDSYYSLLKFDLVGQDLPTHVDDATLRLYNTQYSDYAPTGMYVDELHTASTERLRLVSSQPELHEYRHSRGANSRMDRYRHLVRGKWLGLRPVVKLRNSASSVRHQPQHECVHQLRCDGRHGTIWPELVINWSADPDPENCRSCRTMASSPFMAEMALAAYHVLPQPYEVHENSVNVSDSAADAAYVDIQSQLHLLTAADLPLT